MPNSWIDHVKDLAAHIKTLAETLVEMGGEETMSNPFLSYADSKSIIVPALEKYHLDGSGKCTGSVMRYVPVEEAEKRYGHSGLKDGQVYYKLVLADFINEQDAQNGIGTFIQVVDENGAAESVTKFFHAYPSEKLEKDTWDNGMFDHWDVFTYPGGTGKIDPGRDNYFPADDSEDLGPFVFAVAGYPSDHVAGAGLPHNKHVQYYLKFQRSIWGADEPIDPPVEPVDPPVVIPIPDITGVTKAEVIAARWNVEQATREMEAATARLKGATATLYKIENGIKE